MSKSRITVRRIRIPKRPIRIPTRITIKRKWRIRTKLTR